MVQGSGFYRGQEHGLGCVLQLCQACFGHAFNALHCNSLASEHLQQQVVWGKFEGCVFLWEMLLFQVLLSFYPAVDNIVVVRSSLMFFSCCCWHSLCVFFFAVWHLYGKQQNVFMFEIFVVVFWFFCSLASHFLCFYFHPNIGGYLVCFLQSQDWEVTGGVVQDTYLPTYLLCMQN